jgi:ATP-binding cassette subfamily B protein
MKKFPVCIQHDVMDCGAACIKMLADYHGQSFSLNELKEQCVPTREGLSMSNIATALDNIGYTTVGGRLTVERLEEKAPLPCILHWDQEHFVVLYKVKKKKRNTVFHIADPGIGLLTYNQKEFTEHWCTTQSGGEEKGVTLVIEKKADFNIPEKKHEKTNFGILIPYFLTYKKYFVPLFLGLIIGSIIQLTFPFLTQSIVDIGITNENLTFINTILIAQLVLLISKMCAEFIQNWILLHISTRVNISMVSDFLIKLMKLPMGFFDSKLIGDILQRFGDHKRLEQFITVQSLNVLYASLNFIVFGTILCIFSLKIFFVFILGSVIYICWLLLFMKKRKILDYQLFEQRAINDSKTYELIYGMQEMKLQGCTHCMRWEWEDVQAKLFDVNISLLKLRQNQTAGSVFINETKNIIITFLAAYSVIAGSLSLGMMLAIQFNKMSELGNNIYIKDLSFAYEGTNHFVLKNIDINIPQGTTIAIVGASGSGKTSLVKLLLQYYEIKQGQICIGNHNINDIDTDSWRQCCGAVMQDGYIFSDTIAKNISMSDEIIDTEKLLYAAKIANLDNFVTRLPLKYNTIIGQNGRGLSQGQKQRILIARAIYKMPQYLFLDEATNSLDASNERQITDNLSTFMKGRTVFIVAHRLSTVMNADQILVLNNGEIIERGKHSELVEAKGYYYQLIKNQLELGT